MSDSANLVGLAGENRYRQAELANQAQELVNKDQGISLLERAAERRKKDSKFRSFWEKTKTFWEWFRGNELIRYARWAIVILLISAIAQTFVEWDTFSASVAGHLGKDDATRGETFFHAFWWSVVTFTTVGYGDVSPTSPLGKSLAMVMMLVNLGLVTVLSGTIASVLVARRLQGGTKLDAEKYNQHLVICGWNHMVKEILEMIAGAHPTNNLIVLVNEADEDQVSRVAAEFKALDVTHISGNFTEESVLRSAFVDQSRMCLILPDTSKLGSGEAPDEQRTILATLTAKGISEELFVVAHVLEEGTVPHLKRANANDVVFVDPHVPFMLANHAVRPGVPQLLRMLVEESADAEHALSVTTVPEELAGQRHDMVSAFYRATHQWTVLGYAFSQAGFDLEKQMAESGSPLIRAMIKEQLEDAGIKLSMDEQVAITLNPADEFVVESGYNAVVLT